MSQISDDFSARFPPPIFSAGDVTLYLPILEPIYPSYYGFSYNDETKETTLNLIAHLIINERDGSAFGEQVVASKSADGVSTSFVASINTSTDAEFFNTTKYGQRFLRLKAGGYGGVAV